MRVTEPSYLALPRVIRRQVENRSARNRDGNPRYGEIGDTAPRDGVLLIAWVTREEQGENRKGEEMRTGGGEEGGEEAEEGSSRY